MTSRRETRRAVFLDRDGVLNQTFLRKRKPHPPTDLTEVVVLEGVREACSRLRSAGFLLIMITNQPDVARGTQSLETANTINEYLRNELQLDVVKMCPHDTRDGCNCRKPKPGLLLDAATEYGIDLDGSFVVGDRWKDIDAGRSAGCRTVWLDHDYDEPTATRPDFVTRTLKEASLWILENSHDERGLI